MKARLLGISSFGTGAHWKMDAHCHPCFEMVMIRHGEQAVVTNGPVRRAAAGDILLFRPNCVHREWSDSGRRKEIFCMAFEWEDAPEETPLVSHDDLGRIRVIFNWLLAEQRTRTPLTDKVTQSLLEALLAHFLTLSVTSEGHFVSEVRNYLRDNMTREIGLDKLAEVAGVSKYHLVRKYKAATGRTPMADLRIIRLERARELIMTTSEPLKSIAPAVGLGDIYHMSRLFRRHMDITPGSLRRSAPSS